MEHDGTIPVPDNSGSSGLQKKSEDQQILIKAKLFSGYEVTKAVEGIAATNTRALGGEVSSAVIVATMRQLSSDNEKLQQENRDLNEKLQNLQEHLGDVKTRCAVLRERIVGYGKNKHLRNLGIAVGIGLVGIGLNLARQEVDLFALSALVAGVLLTGLSWYSGPNGDIT